MIVLSCFCVVTCSWCRRLCVCQAFPILHIFLESESQLAASKCTVTCHMYKISQKSKNDSTIKPSRTNVYQGRKVPTLYIVVAPKTPIATTLSISIIVVTATVLIMSSLRLESSQHISRLKILRCHHGNSCVSRTLDLCSLLSGGYCTTQ